MKKMLRWHHDAFEVWKETAIESASRPAWSSFTHWCSLREQGMRRQALQSLREFLSQAHGWSDEARREFADWIMRAVYRRGFVGACLLCHPLVEDLLKPTLRAWLSDEINDPTPCRWLGLLDDDIDMLREAIRRDPREQIARAECIQVFLGRVGYALHELSVGYIGEPHQDLALLREAKELVTGILLSDLQVLWHAEIKTLDELVRAYMEYRETSSRKSFRRWAEAHGRPFEMSGPGPFVRQDYRRRLCP